jgi:hypothetical protein
LPSFESVLWNRLMSEQQFCFLLGTLFKTTPN